MGLVEGDAASASWEAEAQVVTDSHGERAVRGKAIHGPRTERFLYLAWLEGAGAGTMFRRLKLQLDGVPVALLTKALAQGTPLVAELGLTDDKGLPRCASVRPPLVRWTTSARR